MFAFLSTLQVSFTRTRYHECISKRSWQDKVKPKFLLKLGITSTFYASIVKMTKWKNIVVRGVTGVNDLGLALVFGGITYSFHWYLYASYMMQDFKMLFGWACLTFPGYTEIGDLSDPASDWWFCCCELAIKSALWRHWWWSLAPDEWLDTEIDSVKLLNSLFKSDVWCYFALRCA